MYVPKHFEITDVKVMHELIHDYPLATLVTMSANGLNANHIPIHLNAMPEPYGTLQGHVARSNPLLEDINGENQSLAIFHGPNAYITPSWYETKKEHGKVVPTWNYVVVHAYGNLQVVDKPEWLRAQLETLTDQNESQFSEPWAVADAPTEFTEKLFESIVGIEMKITKLLGKWKVSQNQPMQNKVSVIKGLKDKQQQDMADLVGKNEY
ncbi:FMN-binding negative transcriptional regulator [Methyloglobulus sp.]|uniref:FMN-binding negative transcriptional regulator n=1 Tax=Methyloglobulus sp. TaxID=2518622 RepID=UPI0032B7A260